MLTFSLSCVICDGPLSGRQTVVCSPRCAQARKRAAKMADAEYLARLMGRDCAYCRDVFDPRTASQKYCDANCAAAAQREAEEVRYETVCELDGCEKNAGWDGVGAPRRFCCNAHKQKAYRLRKAAESAPESR
ncbi:hypothetical protein [Streptomyces sp. NPDC048410]|uniref:hypothetical protein n=1 Tax=Streptomyces sp. NPDC048410 TaxID=3365545 RepID=UPI003715E796